MLVGRRPTCQAPDLGAHPRPSHQFSCQFCKIENGWRRRTEEIVRGEFAENAIRKDFLPSEIEAIRRAMLPAETVAAKGRMVSAHASHGKFPEQAKSTTRDKIGASA